MKLDVVNKLIQALGFPEIMSVTPFADSRNAVYRLKPGDASPDLVLKIFSEGMRSSFAAENFVSDSFPEEKSVKKVLAYQAESEIGAFNLSFYIEGRSLREVLERGALSEPEQVVDQLEGLLKKTHTISVDGFGRFLDEGATNSKLSWENYLMGYLQQLENRVLSQRDQAMMMPFLESLTQFFQQEQSYLKAVSPKLTFVDLNTSNFLLTEQGQLIYTDTESVWGADPLLAYGDWLGNTAETPLGDLFLNRVHEQSTQKIIAAYALMSNLGALLFMAEQTNTALEKACPWGNPHTYLDLMTTHQKKL